MYECLQERPTLYRMCRALARCYGYCMLRLSNPAVHVYRAIEGVFRLPDPIHHYQVCMWPRPNSRFEVEAEESSRYGLGSSCMRRDCRRRVECWEVVGEDRSADCDSSTLDARWEDSREAEEETDLRVDAEGREEEEEAVEEDFPCQARPKAAAVGVVARSSTSR